MSADHKLLFTEYDNNDGDPLAKVKQMLSDLQEQMPADVRLVKPA